MEKLFFSFAKFKYYCYTALALVLTIIILVKPAECLSYACNGLLLWFDRMIPTLFPFMVLSGVMIRMHLTDAFVKLLKPILGPLLRVSPACIYGVVIGFLCGFPMGAHTAAQLYETKQISKDEASFLLSFCNNIGPVYFLSFVLPTLGLSHPACFLFGMYGLPFLYGIFLRYTRYRNVLPDTAPHQRTCNRTLASASYGPSDNRQRNLLEALDDSVFTSLSGIAKLGGYMVFFNLLFILPALIFPDTPVQGMMSCLLEITGGIGLVQNRLPLFVLIILPFGGLSCIAQTYSMIKNTGLSITEYVMHKMILTAVTVCYYCLSAGRYF